VTYAVDGRQYVAVLAGFGGPEVLVNTPLGDGRTGPGRLLVFALDGQARLPEPEPPLPPIAKPELMVNLTATQFERGRRLFSDFCVDCHGIDAVSGGITPDLRRTTAAVHAQISEIVLGSAREPLGMPSFADLLNEEDLRLIQGYILTRAHESAGGF
jgi:quinohemoprotein ethanol dehydrogenase